MSEPHATPQGDPDQSGGPGEPTAVREPGLLQDFRLFLVYNKKWWIVPILLALLLIGLLVVLSDPGPNPFVYPQM